MYWITGILGLALIVAPFVLGYSTNATALWSSLILCAAIAIVSAYKARVHDVENWEYWLAGILGLAAVLAPYVLGFSVLGTALWAMLILGAAGAVLSSNEVFFQMH